MFTKPDQSIAALLAVASLTVSSAVYATDWYNRGPSGLGFPPVVAPVVKTDPAPIRAAAREAHIAAMNPRGGLMINDGPIRVDLHEFAIQGGRLVHTDKLDHNTARPRERLPLPYFDYGTAP